MPYILPPQEDKLYTGEYNWLWVQKATAIPPDRKSTRLNSSH